MNSKLALLAFTLVLIFIIFKIIKYISKNFSEWKERFKKIESEGQYVVIKSAGQNSSSQVYPLSEKPDEKKTYSLSKNKKTYKFHKFFNIGSNYLALFLFYTMEAGLIWYTYWILTKYKN